jgi:hypothetical protein
MREGLVFDLDLGNGSLGVKGLGDLPKKSRTVRKRTVRYNGMRALGRAGTEKPQR